MLTLSLLTCGVRARNDLVDREIEALLARLDRVEEGIAAVRRMQDEQAAARDREIRDLARAIAIDAEARGERPGQPRLAGWSDGFRVAADDGTFEITIGGRIQARYVANRQDTDDTGDAFRGGFEVRRARLEIRGHVADPSWRYGINVDARFRTGSFFILDSWIRKRLEHGWAIQVGRFRLPFDREHDIAVKRLLALERSIVARAFSPGRGDAVMFRFQDEDHRLRLAFDNTLDKGISSPDLRSRKFGLMARIERRVAGNWGRFADVRSDGAEFAMLVGIGGLFEVEDFNALPALGTLRRSDSLGWTADVTVEQGPYNASASFTHRYVDPDEGPTLHQWGAVVQAGVLLDATDEVFIRYEWGDDGGPAEPLHLITIGANRYLYGHDVRFSADAGYALTPVSPTWSSPVVGYRTDEPGESGQIVVRTQLQLLF